MLLAKLSDSLPLRDSIVGKWGHPGSNPRLNRVIVWILSLVSIVLTWYK